MINRIVEMNVCEKVKLTDLGNKNCSSNCKEQKPEEINAGLDSVPIRVLRIWLKNKHCHLCVLSFYLLF